MLRPLTYISGFLGKALYVVPTAVRLTARCPVIQARISVTSVEELHAMLRNVPVYLFWTGQSAFDWTVQVLNCVNVAGGPEASCTWGAQYR